MDEFRILSIEEFDADFVQKKRVNKTVTQPPKQSLIPELAKNESDNKSQTVDAEVKPETTETSFLNVNFENETDEIESEESEVITSEEKTSDKKSEKSSESRNSKHGILAGKIISIILLCVTVVVFFLGCFVSVFINNDGVDIGGICLNSQVRDIRIGEDTIKEGSLIISKKIEASDYTANINKPVAVPVENTPGCDIQYIYSAENISEYECVITGYDPETNHINDIGVSSVDSYGIVTHYLPAAGGIVVFAMNNAILVCALFVLLSALWCMLLVLFEKNKKKNK
ncbi:MAG: hypothetical protein IKB88_06915 [Clostridia bacterium]|nr:hypothetical protein [Clostridia bacterium]